MRERNLVVVRIVQDEGGLRETRGHEFGVEVDDWATDDPDEFSLHSCTAGDGYA